MADVAEALAPVIAMLAAEDYHLSITPVGEAWFRLTVAAGPEACEYCLVPKSTLVSIAEKHLSAAGVAGGLRLDIVYPDEVAPASGD